MPRALASEPGFAPTDLQGCALGLRNLLVGGGWASTGGCEPRWYYPDPPTGNGAWRDAIAAGGAL